MPEKGKKIDVIFRREDFEEVYYKDRQGNIFLSPELKTDFIITVITLPLTIASILYFSEMGRAWLLPFTFSFVLLVSGSKYILKLMNLLRWKKNVRAYFNHLENVQYLGIIATDEALTDIEDEKITVLKWSSFSKAVITPDLISLTGPDLFLLPKKSVSEADFNFLKGLITSKIQGE